MKGTPTQEQLKKFWEWCGLRYEIDEDEYKVILPGGEWYNFGHDADLKSVWEITEPELDLNNLFKYAVPKLRSVYLQSDEEHKFWCMALIGDAKSKLHTYVDPALALFWAIWELVEASPAPLNRGRGKE